MSTRTNQKIADIIVVFELRINPFSSYVTIVLKKLIWKEDFNHLEEDFGFAVNFGVCLDRGRCCVRL